MAKPQEMEKVVNGAPKQQAVVNSIESLLKAPNYRARFEDMLKEKAPAFISSIISAVALNKDLKACDPMSVISSAAIAATLDLPINQNLGFAYLIPYSGRCQFQMGYKGYIQLAMRSAQYKTMNASEVYEDELKLWNPITGEFEHTDSSTWKFRGENKHEKIVGYIAFFRLINGFEKYLYMTKNQVEIHARRYSKSYENPSGRWKADFLAMAKKTVLKNLLSKFGILSVEMQKAIQVDQAIVNVDSSLEYADNPAIESESIGNSYVSGEA